MTKRKHKETAVFCNAGGRAGQYNNWNKFEENIMSTKFDKMIEIITAIREGKKIQCRFANSIDKWTLTDILEPNFQEYEYRIYHAMPKFRVALMFDANIDYYYTVTINKESQEQTLQETPKFISWVTSWITCSLPDNTNLAEYEV